MIFIKYDLFSLVDKDLKSNTYFILNSNNDYSFIDLTLNNFKSLEEKFDFHNDEINIFYTSEKPNQFEDLIDYFKTNYNDSKINIYINEKYNDQENINFIKDFSRIEIGYITINKIDLPGTTKKGIGFKYKENVFTGTAISTNFKYDHIEDKQQWKKTFEWFKKEITDNYLICSLYGEQMKKSHWMLQIKKREE